MDPSVNHTVRCLIVENEPLAARLLEKHIAQFSQLALVGSAWNAFEAFELLKQQTVDLIFLDIQMPGLTGIDFIKSMSNPPDVIFTTAYREYAVESYELDAVDYLLKPITIDRFFRAIQKYLQRTETSPWQKQVPPTTDADAPDHLYVNTNRKHVRIVFEEVLYIESLKDYIRIHTADQAVTTKEKISAFEDQLPDYFLRIHRSFIVNTRQVTAFTANDVEIGDREIPIGVSYKQLVKARFEV